MPHVFPLDFRPKILCVATQALALILLVGLAACSTGRDNVDDVLDPSREAATAASDGGGIFGLSGPSGRSAVSGAPRAGVGVNSYLWRASLDTLSFMPLSSADPFGGVIITEWFAPPASPEERFKVTVYILDTRLRADGVRVSVFRQTRQANGDWLEASLDPSTPSKLENAILSRARQLRLASTE